MIKAIIFDCFGVLTIDLWKQFKATLPASLQNQASDLNHAYDAGLLTESQFINQVKRLTGRKPWQVEELSKYEVAKNRELINYIRRVKSSYKIGMISNIASNWVRDEFLTKDEQSLFDDMVFSYEVGVTKPDARIFNFACERLNIKPEHTIFTDDSPTHCEGAAKVGMKTILYTDYGQMKRELEQMLG